MYVRFNNNKTDIRGQIQQLEDKLAILHSIQYKQANSPSLSTAGAIKTPVPVISSFRNHQAFPISDCFNSTL
jgi:hypothetical protein